MSIQIKVKNVTSKPIVFTVGETEIKIQAGKEGEVPLDLVRTPELAEHFATGGLVFAPNALHGFDAIVRAQAVEVIGQLVLKTAPRFLAHHSELEVARANLSALKERYNDLHKATAALIVGAKQLTPGVTTVLQTTKLLSAVEEDQVAAAEKALAEHLKLLPKKPEELAEWYVEHKRLDAARDAAVRARDQAKSALARQLDRTTDELGAAAEVFGKVDAKDIGNPVTWG